MKNRFLIKAMNLIVESLTGYRSSDSVIAAMNEEFAEQELLLATKSEMARKLREHREKGRHGWWNKDVCSIEQLYSYRKKALDENDHVSVLNFTAMIAAREAYENHQTSDLMEKGDA
ncbi:hypothetical protein [Vibrio cholerae]|uniref:hypothetical protein n=1 Tax=Vibrio cholerae TaxID=666 RepID=UPI0011D325E0|nr:hypothetical protein [Vibrio cholerae]MDV2400302.1 hypothetical protein [Vibrio cholerae]TYA60799.1 hypothetical protein FXE55_02240 [Vibrio cholerae]GHW54562.1 hypothetical protein VCSRO57_2356 [Vibrio cholerae]